MFKRLIPSILISNDRLVKGKNFTNFKDAGKPSTTARAYNHQGADELIVSDIESSRNNIEPNFRILKDISREVFMPLTFFGGIKNTYTARKCMEFGADKIGLNTTAIRNPNLITKLSRQLGSQAIVIGIDFIKENNSYYIFDHTSKKPIEDINPIFWAKKVVSLGCGEIRLMSVDREGTKKGYDFEFYNLIRKEVKVPLILDGGAGSLEDLEKAFDEDIQGISLGTILVFADNNIIKIKKHLLTKNKNIRDK